MHKPMVGVGIIIIKEGKILLGKRKSTLDCDKWCIPGGKLEYKEDMEDCARRELFEETEIKGKNFRIGTVTNDLFESGEHYVSICFVCDYSSGNLEVKEPDKFQELEWFDWEKLPEPLCVPVANMKKKGFNPFEAQFR